MNTSLIPQGLLAVVFGALAVAVGWYMGASGVSDGQVDLTEVTRSLDSLSDKIRNQGDAIGELAARISGLDAAISLRPQPTVSDPTDSTDGATIQGLTSEQKVEVLMSLYAPNGRFSKYWALNRARESQDECIRALAESLVVAEYKESNPDAAVLRATYSKGPSAVVAADLVARDPSEQVLSRLKENYKTRPFPDNFSLALCLSRTGSSLELDDWVGTALSEFHERSASDQMEIVRCCLTGAVPDAELIAVTAAESSIQKVRLKAALLLARINTSRSIEELRKLTEDTDPGVAARAQTLVSEVEAFGGQR